MTNRRLFDILEYLIDHCQFYMEIYGNNEGFEYCNELRLEVFSNKVDNPLTFDILTTEIKNKLNNEERMRQYYVNELMRTKNEKSNNSNSL